MDVRLGLEAYKFLKEEFNTLEKQPSGAQPSIIPIQPGAALNDPVILGILQHPLVSAKLSQKLAENPPRDNASLQQVIQDAFTEINNLGVGVIQQAQIDTIKTAFGALPLDYSDTSLLSDALVDTFTTQPTAEAPPMPDDTIRNALVQDVDPAQKRIKEQIAAAILQNALDNDRVGKVIAERKREIQMKATGIRKLPNGTPATCLPLKPTGHDINAVTTTLLDLKDKSGVHGSAIPIASVFTTSTGAWNDALENYMRTFVKAKVISEWAFWQKLSRAQPATRDCVPDDLAGIVDWRALERGPAQRRSTRRAPRRSQRKSRKQRGGAKQKRRVQRGGANFHTITIDTIPKSERSYQLVLTTKGVAMNPADVRNPNPSSTSKSLTDLFMNVILKENTSTSAGSSVASRFRPLGASDVGTYDKLTSIYETIMNVQEGPSLAAYRAFSLLSNLETGGRTPRAYTYVCKDQMVGRRASNEVQYATLESLYLDIQETEKPNHEQPGRTNLQSALGEFVTKAYYTAVPGSTPQTFGDLTISSVLTADQTRDLCGVQGVTGTAANVDVLRKAHAELRKLYDIHINWVRTFVMTHFMIVRGTDKQLVINPKLAFPSKNGKITTIQKELERLIDAEVRTKIAIYYLNVERVYADAVRRLTSPY